MSEILFKESQRFKQWWIWAILILLNGLSIFSVIWQIGLQKPFGNNPASDTGVIVIAILVALFSLGIMSIRLDSRISADGIEIRFFPFRMKYKLISWSDMDKCYLREYHAIQEFGGWGYRLGIMGKGRAMNISGNIGIQIEFKDGKKLLIGTNRSNEAEEVIAKFQSSN